MRAITYNRYGSADVLRPRDLAVPAVGDKEVLIEVHSAGVDRSVVHLLSGQPRLVRLVSGLRAPRHEVIGADVAGTIAAVGSSVTRFAVGDEVFGTARGSYAQFAVAGENRLVAKPGSLGFAEAASLPISGCAALHALRRAKPLPGQDVLILNRILKRRILNANAGNYAISLMPNSESWHRFM